MSYDFNIEQPPQGIDPNLLQWLEKLHLLLNLWHARSFNDMGYGLDLDSDDKLGLRSDIEALISASLELHLWLLKALGCGLEVDSSGSLKVHVDSDTVRCGQNGLFVDYNYPDFSRPDRAFLVGAIG